jgi:preprotein translocase subunit SecG
MRELYILGCIFAYLQFVQYINVQFTKKDSSFSRIELLLLPFYNFIYYLFIVLFLIYAVAIVDFILKQLRMGDNFVSSQVISTNEYLQKHSKTFVTLICSQFAVFLTIYIIIIGCLAMINNSKSITKKYIAQRELFITSFIATTISCLIFYLI